jgi:chemotaxis protein methyltransferase CheR
MIQSRLRHRLKASGFDNFDSYADFVSSEAGKLERLQMISALTTNVSHFFREKHHFDRLANDILPKRLQQHNDASRMTIWSAGCSNGQEAFSIAMTVLETVGGLKNFDFKILATDIDPKVIAFASGATYPEILVAGIPPALIAKYFDRHENPGGPLYAAKDTLKSRVVFKRLNLLSEWPMRHRMDIIFCRNVVTCFDQKTQRKLWPRFRDQLKADGQLFLGHSERIADPLANGFVSDGPTSYRPSSGTDR